MRKIIYSALTLMAPLMASAATIEDVISTVRGIVDAIIPLFMVVAVAVFLWGIIQYITSAGDEEKRKSAQGYIVYGLIGLFVMVAFWGIIKVVSSTFGVQEGGTINLPSISP
ncbi:MAG: hypothetical protein A3A10_01925 [Candidatus Tagabacteria bacterium RIFCSPLOWO2_01_FULL_42_9]|uniref:Uncharacterized protein n=1 Tax=Candidatus Tagabacteria bacterium RIFCSPLOWO2_01_FULL_42_9 TaxID=1802296 RepID=A0A1G2LVS5_9BACT|nr:MAG: hypothetical protein A3A10_01925 [Candidatus Tagabacteria bacterium RIFCSPLOWO2_01_FULL_42_9]